MMLHAIGFSRKSIKKNKYMAYRNRYVVSTSDNDWDELVFYGYATKIAVGNNVIYHLTANGITYLESVLSIKIIQN